MAGRRDEIKQGVHPVVLETGVTLDSRLLGEDIVVLTLNVAHDFLESVKTRKSMDCVTCRVDIRKLVVNAVAKSWRIDHSQSDTDTLFLEFYCQVTFPAMVRSSIKAHRCWPV